MSFIGERGKGCFCFPFSWVVSHALCESPRKLGGFKRALLTGIARLLHLYSSCRHELL